MLRGVPLPLPVVRRLTSPAYVRKSARTSGFGFGLEALDEPEPEFEPHPGAATFDEGLEDAALLGTASERPLRRLSIDEEVGEDLQEDRVSYLYGRLSQLSAARSWRRSAAGAAGREAERAADERSSRGWEEIEKLQIELTAREQERAETEERLCGAYNDVIRDLHQTVRQLTMERDALALALEGVNGRRSSSILLEDTGSRLLNSVI